jgi:hypothetical protein
VKGAVIRRTPWSRGEVGEVDGHTHTVAVRWHGGRPACAACVNCGQVFAYLGGGNWTPVPEPNTAPLWAYP